MSSAAEIEAVLFKPIGDRYVFQAPNPWVFGSKDRYLVTTHKSKSCLRSSCPDARSVRIAVITIGILLWTVGRIDDRLGGLPARGSLGRGCRCDVRSDFSPDLFRAGRGASAKSAAHAADPCRRAAHRGTHHAPRTASGHDQSDLAAASAAPGRVVDRDLRLPGVHSRHQKCPASASERRSVLPESLHRDRRRRTWSSITS